MKSPFDSVVVRRTGLILAGAAVFAIGMIASRGSGGSALSPTITWLSLGGCVLAARSAAVVTRRRFRRELARPVDRRGGRHT